MSNLSWIEKQAGYECICYPYDGAEGIIKAILSCSREFGGDIIRAEYVPHVGVEVVYRDKSLKHVLPYEINPDKYVWTPNKDKYVKVRVK